MAEQQNRGNKRLFEAFGGGSDSEDYVQTAADCGKSDVNSANSDIAAADNSDVEQDDIDIENSDNTVIGSNINKDQTNINEEDGSNGMGGRKRKCLNPTRISANGDNKAGDNQEDGNFSSDDNDEGNIHE